MRQATQMSTSCIQRDGHDAANENVIDGDATRHHYYNSQGAGSNGSNVSPTPQRQPNTLWLAYQTLGMVYGGLSTSPLYLYSSLPSKTSMDEDDYLGVLSIIFWTLTLIGVFKYSMVVLHADDHGEGGTFALYSLLCQHTSIGEWVSLKKRSGKNLKLDAPNIHKRSCMQEMVLNFLNKSKISGYVIFGTTMLATCMLMGDGVLTPAISVLSAMEGLKIAIPSISQSVVIFLSSILLIGLFLLQRFGTHHLSSLFSPIILAWLIVTPVLGVYNIMLHYPMIYRAISPHYMMIFFSRHGKDAWLVLGGTSLCIAGAEAMFADLGHFNKASMQLGFLLGVYPSNMLTYAGLTAYLIDHPQHQAQAFYKFTPPCVFWPVFVISTFAAIVASQGLISACFSLIKQCVALDYFPRVQFIHTSHEHRGQVYSPQVNTALMIFCSALVIFFQDGAALANAYGVAVMIVMLITTILISLVMVVVWGVSLPWSVGFMCFFGFIEATNLSAVLSKVPKGGWLPLLLATLLVLVVFSWVYGRRKKKQYEENHNQTLKTAIDLRHIARVPGVGFFFTSLHQLQEPQEKEEYEVLHLPIYLLSYLQTSRSLPRVSIFIHIQIHPHLPCVPTSHRFSFTRASSIQRGIYFCTFHCGFGDPISQWRNVSHLLLQHLEQHILTNIPSLSSTSSNKDQCLPLPTTYVDYSSPTSRPNNQNELTSSPNTSYDYVFHAFGDEVPNDHTIMVHVDTHALEVTTNVDFKDSVETSKQQNTVLDPTITSMNTKITLGCHLHRTMRDDKTNELDKDLTKELSEELMEVEQAKEDVTSLACSITSRARLKSKEGSSLIKQVTIDTIYAFLQKNCTPSMPPLDIPTDSLLEIHIVYEV